MPHGNAVAVPAPYAAGRRTRAPTATPISPSQTRRADGRCEVGTDRMSTQPIPSLATFEHASSIADWLGWKGVRQRSHTFNDPDDGDAFGRTLFWYECRATDGSHLQMNQCPIGQIRRFAAVRLRASISPRHRVPSTRRAGRVVVVQEPEGDPVVPHPHSLLDDRESRTVSITTPRVRGLDAGTTDIRAAAIRRRQERGAMTRAASAPSRSSCCWGRW